VCRKHLQEIPSDSSNVSPNLACSWDSGRALEPSSTGVPALKKGDENTLRDLQESPFSPPLKRQKTREVEKDLDLGCRPRLYEEAESGVSWDALPDELLLSIFAYLPLHDLLLGASLTCKRWHNLSMDECLWQSLDLAAANLPPGVIGQLLPAGVTIFRCPRSSIRSPFFKTDRPLRVQHMDLSNCTVSVGALESILCRCKRLQNLSLEGLAISDIIMMSIAENPNMTRLNLCGCSGFSPETLGVMLNNCFMLQELNLSWCDFTCSHIKVTVHNITATITQLNLSGYRQNLQISDVKVLVERCPLISNLDLSDSVMLKAECFQYFYQLSFLEHLSLSRCYQISPTSLLQLAKHTTLKTLQVFGIVSDCSLRLLRATYPHIAINASCFTNIARPSFGIEDRRMIWGMKCRLSLKSPNK
ncbi:SKP2 protein, partial [Centropus bengalensis]|nr:SKP2 protein [Centropus bengalensis]